MNLTLKIWRQPDAASTGAMHTYDIEDVSADMSFLEMLDVLNEQLNARDEEPIAFDSDCREGICGMCGLMINGEAHGPQVTTTCQLHMRSFKDGEALRHDDQFAYVAAWEYAGETPVLHKEELTYTAIEMKQRSYK